MKEIAEIKRTMSSIDIAELTGKSHDYILKAIRKMEPAWESVTGSKFDCSFIIKELQNGGSKKQPCYVLSKTECLYIATKFNDEARAKLVIRWEELERPEKPLDPLSDIEALAEHTKRPVQVQNSKNVNGHLIRNWDVETAIRYNREHCKLVTGWIAPNEVRKMGKQLGLKSSERTSAKEVLRHIKPEWAAQMSINDYLVEHGKRLAAAIELTKPCVPLLGELKRLKA